MNTLSKLQVETPTDREIRVTRTFNAPAQLVWDAHTKPELLKRWLGGYDGWSMPVCEMDVRVGGTYRWRWRMVGDGKEFGFHGKFIEVTPTTKLVHQEEYDPGDMGVSMNSEPAIITTVFKETSGLTTLTVTMLFASKEDRDAAIATGMTDGMEVSYQRMDALFAS
jgi:uncharacterized protein YndB with AHSA1/START domain